MGSFLSDFATAAAAVVEPETTALAVAQLMRKHHLGAVVVVAAQGQSQPVGIVTDRDLVLELMAEGLDPAVFTAGDIMSVNLVSARPDMEATQAVDVMKANGVRRLVVTDAQGRIVGVVTLEDVPEALPRDLAYFVLAFSQSAERGTRSAALTIE